MDLGFSGQEYVERIGKPGYIISPVILIPPRLFYYRFQTMGKVLYYHGIRHFSLRNVGVAICISWLC
jgi:hypothetical protein